MSKIILIFGVSGVDGSNLAEYLFNLNENFKIYGSIRNRQKLKRDNLKKFINNKNTFELKSIFEKVQPDYIFNFQK